MQPPLQLQKFDSHLSGDKLALTERELAEYDIKKQNTNMSTNKFDNKSFNMVKASSFMSFSNKQVNRAKHGSRMNFRASQITTQKVKSNNFNTSKGA